MEVVQLLGLQGFWQHQVLRGVGSQGSRRYRALEGHGSQYWPICSSLLAWGIPSLTEKPGRPQSQGRRESDTTQATLCTQVQDFFAWGNFAPVRVEREGGAAAGLVGTLVVPSVQGHGRLCRRSYDPIRAFF